MKITGQIILPASGKQPKALVVLLHGYGGNGINMFYMLSDIQKMCPDVAIAIPDGPFILGMEAFAWVKLTFPIRLEQVWEGADSIAKDMDEFYSHELGKLGLHEKDLMLIGFSQGGIMALHTGLRRKEAPVGIISISGFLVGERHLGEITSRPPVYLIGGERDMVVTPDEIARSESELIVAGVSVEKKIIPGLAHGISKEVIDQVLEILKASFL
jgi:phospholipase/carboxylesterase